MARLAEYLASERDQDEKHDWYEGEVFAMSGGTLRHASLGANVSRELGNALRGGACRVLSADAKVVAHIGWRRRRVLPHRRHLICVRASGFSRALRAST